MRQQAYTHVHLLAHGQSRQAVGGEQFCLTFHHERDPGQESLADGEQLASALRAHTTGAEGGMSLPTAVTLEACDAGNPGSVLVPGASLAHALHEAWPWASIVAYASFPPDLDAQLRKARLDRTVHAASALLARMDVEMLCAEPGSGSLVHRRDELSRTIEGLERALPAPEAPGAPATRAYFLGHCWTGGAKKAALERARGHTRELVRRMGRLSFHVHSTRRQLKRYRDWWCQWRPELAAFAAGLFQEMGEDSPYGTTRWRSRRARRRRAMATPWSALRTDGHRARVAP